jgi:hypothetical protein
MFVLRSETKHINILCGQNAELNLSDKLFMHQKLIAIEAQLDSLPRCQTRSPEVGRKKILRRLYLFFSA